MRNDIANGLHSGAPTDGSGGTPASHDRPADRSPIGDADLARARACAPAEYRLAAVMLKALAHENRLALLSLLAQRPHNVAEMETALGLPQTAISQQLARLRRQRLVDCRRDGRRVTYRLAEPRIGSLVGKVVAIVMKGSRAATAGQSAASQPTTRRQSRHVQQG